ncbi:MAG: hypothetical protein Q9198_001077 [Flavoplaca austrocitrina]
MHYPGGAGAKKPFIGHRKTVLGRKDNPDESFKKNMKPSSVDVGRANVMYSTPENKKRDITKACGDEPPAEQPPPEEPVPEEGDEDDQEDAEEDAEDEQEDAEEDAEEAEEESEDD